MFSVQAEAEVSSFVAFFVCFASFFMFSFQDSDFHNFFWRLFSAAAPISLSPVPGL